MGRISLDGRILRGIDASLCTRRASIDIRTLDCILPKYGVAD